MSASVRSILSVIPRVFAALWPMLLRGLLSLPLGGAALAAHGETMALCAPDAVPLAYVADGKLTGLSVGLVTEAFRRTGRGVDIQIRPWARCLEEGRVGSVDGIFTAFKTAERESFLAYADEILVTQAQAFFTKKGSPLIFDGNLGSFHSKNVGIVNKTSYGSRFDQALKEEVFSRVDISNNTDMLVRKLSADRVDIIVGYRHVVLFAAKQAGVQDEIKELLPEIEAIPSYIAFTRARDLTRTRNEFNAALTAMKGDGTYDRIVETYVR